MRLGCNAGPGRTQQGKQADKSHRTKACQFTGPGTYFCTSSASALSDGVGMLTSAFRMQRALQLACHDATPIKG